MLLVALILYVLGCVLMIDNIRATPPGERWTQSGLILLIIVWGWPFVTATTFVHDLILPLFKLSEKKKPD